MLDMKRAYTAWCNTTDREKDLSTALRWALDQAADGQHVTLWCWDMQSLPGSVVAWASSRGVIIHSERPRPRGGGSAPRPCGPVVAVNLPLDRLVEIEPCQHPIVLVHANAHENDEMAGWIGGEDLRYERPWLEAFQPECLAGPAIATTKPLIADGVVAAALESFTATTFGGTTMHDYRDSDRVTHGVMVLRRGGHIIEPNLLFAAALREGWKGREALRLWKVAKEVAKGVKKRPKHRYQDDILDHWRAEAKRPGLVSQGHLGR